MDKEPAIIPDSRPHLPLLDGVRGLAIFLVMLFHMTYVGGGFEPPAAGLGAVDSAARSVFSVGWCGVDLFFVLSGFLITGILYDTRAGEGYFRIFYARRALRIFPLYYLVVFVSLVLLPAIGAHLSAAAQGKLARFGSIAGDEWMYWTYLSNYAIALAGKYRHGILDISWSLAIEEQFYLVWPAVVLCFSRRTLMKICVGAAVAAVATRCGMVWSGASAIAVHVLTPCRLDALAVGAFLALAVRGPGGLAPLVRLARPLSVVLGAVLLCDLGYRAISRTGRAGEEGLFSANLPELQTVGLSVIAIFFGAVLVLVLDVQQRASGGGVIGRVMGSRILRAFGKYSYAMYLFHLPIRAVPRDLLFAKQIPLIAGMQLPAQIAFAAGCMALTFGAAWLSWNLYEKRWLALKRFFEYGERRRVGS
ncbi:MAG: acyltransferase [Phycisphaerales bacterium]|nr:acyltransferase [Planctomycetota bacterium]